MFNLTCDEESSVDVGGIWTGPDQFELSFRFNRDGVEDVNIHFFLTRDEVDVFQDWLHRHLQRNKVE